MIKRNIYSQTSWRTYLDPVNNPRVQRFLDINGYEIFEDLIVEIETVIDKKSKSLVVLIHPNATSVINIPVEEFDDLLNHSLQYYINNELYESCSNITRIIEKNKKYQIIKNEV